MLYKFWVFYPNLNYFLLILLILVLFYKMRFFSGNWLYTCSWHITFATSFLASFPIGTITSPSGKAVNLLMISTQKQSGIGASPMIANQNTPPTWPWWLIQGQAHHPGEPIRLHHIPDPGEWSRARHMTQDHESEYTTYQVMVISSRMDLYPGETIRTPPTWPWWLGQGWSHDPIASQNILPTWPWWLVKW